MTRSTGVSRIESGDQSRRFLFEQADIRGEAAHLDAAYQDILAIHQYGIGASRLLGEFLAAAVLLSTNLKFEGKLILQVRSEGQIPLLMVECDHCLHVRGIVRGAQRAISNDNHALLHNGQLAITVDPTNGQRYQGVVPLQQGSVAESLDAYFAQSEQLRTRIWLAADGRRAGGLLLQELPAHIAHDQALRQQHWEHLCSLATTVQTAELLELDCERLLYRLFHADPLRIFEPRSVQFRCTCSRERTRSVLATLDPMEIEELLENPDGIEMECEFCNQVYRFNKEDFSQSSTDQLSKSLH